MTRLGLAALVVLATFVSGISGVNAADDEAGLVAEYFYVGSANDFPKIDAKQKPTLVRVDKQVNYPDVTGDFYGSKLVDNFYVRWNGTLRAPKDGKYEFFLESDDGSRLSIDGKEVVNDGGVHPMTEATGNLELKAGDHAIKIEFFQGNGEAGVIASWHPPGGKREAIPEKVFFHSKAAEQIDWDKAAWEKKAKGKMDVHGTAAAGKGGKPDKMNYGPFHTATVESGYPEKGNVALKGLAIKLTKDTTQAPPPEGKEPGKMAAACFDTDLLRYSCGWVDGFLIMPTGRDGLEGHPTVTGTAVFGTKNNRPGWLKGDDTKDPRAEPFGPLPADWAKYRGLYLNEDKVVLSYTVGDTKVLETPGFEAKDGVEVFTRTFSVGKSVAPLTLTVCEADKVTAGLLSGGDKPGTEKSGPASALAVLDQTGTYTCTGIAGNVGGLTWDIKGDDKGSGIYLKIPAADTPAKFTLCIWKGPSTDASKFASYVKAIKPIDVEALTKGGPPRWTPEITVQGTLGEDTDAYTVDTVTVPYENPWDAYMRITGIDFFPDGHSAAVCTMSGDVWTISGIDSKLEKVTWKRYATGLFQSLGLKIVDGKVYVLARDQITRLHDLNNDGEADFYECFNNDCCVGNAYHEFAHDLHTDTEGNFYYAKGSNLGDGGHVHNGTLVKVYKDGSKSEVIAVGFRAPNGMCVGPHNEITTSDNQGNWTPDCPINWIYPPNSPVLKPGEFGFYGFRLKKYPYTMKGPRIDPLTWLPYNIDNSSGGQVWVTSDKWGPLQGHMLAMSYGQSLLFSVMYEKVGDIMQGGTIKFPLKFASGIMRARFNAGDGQLYVVGMRGWQTNAAKAGCVQRVRYTGKPAHMPLDYHITKNGVDITFTDTVDPAVAGDEQTWSAQWYSIVYSANYGSPEFNVTDPKKKGRENIEVTAAKVGADGKTVSLTLPKLHRCDHLVIKYKMKFADGAQVSQELYATVNKMPE